MDSVAFFTFRPLATVAVFLTTLVLVLKRPWRLHEAWAALIGSFLMLALGLEAPEQAWNTVLQGKDVLLFLLALMIFSALIDQTGFFEWAAIHAAKAAKGSGRALFRNVFLVGAAITALLSLDTTAIILTPIVMSFINRLKLEPRPFLLACAFVSNTGSLLLPVSNLTNLLFQSAFDIPFVSFTLHMALAQIVVIALNYWIMFHLFKSSLPEKYDDDLPEPSSVIKDETFFRSALIVLLLVLIGYFAASQVHVPPYIIASIGCVILFVCGLSRKRLDVPKLHKDIDWTLFPFVIGLFVVMRAVENLGLAKSLAAGLKSVGDGLLPQITINAFANAIGSNLINNIPMALLSISVIKEFHASGFASQFGALLGCNLGPNITVTGSLATMLVIASARKRGANVSAQDFFKAGIKITPLLLLAGSVVLWAVCSVFQ
ncbi:MAG TPA: ArsB/NhaD family transporter [Planktothrix sp.]|jgi:arsenical pump membrane protein